MTDDEAESERRFIAAAQLRNERELEQLVMKLAFAIDDPCGADEIRLARALIRMGRSIAPDQRAITADKIEDTCERITALQRTSL